MFKFHVFETFNSIKNAFKRKPKNSCESQSSYLLAAFVSILEDILFWRVLWLSLSFILIVNVFFFICVHRQVQLSGFVLSLCLTSLIMDAIETWLKYKHRTTFLKQLANDNPTELNTAANRFCGWIKTQWNDFLYMRVTNHTKAFILINIYLIIVLLIANYMNGYVLTYLLLMFTCVFYKLILPVLKLFKHMKRELESDSELESLIPDVSEGDIKLLSIEPDQAQSQSLEERQIYDYWKPNDVPLEECSDSSDNSSSLVTNFSMEKIQTLDKDSTDTSEDEYIPLEQHKGELLSTLEVVEPARSWSSAAYNMLWNIKDTIASTVQNNSTTNERKRLLSKDSSDGFEIIDKSDLT